MAEKKKKAAKAKASKKASKASPKAKRALVEVEAAPVEGAAEAAPVAARKKGKAKAAEEAPAKAARAGGKGGKFKPKEYKIDETPAVRRGKGPHYLVVVESPTKAKTIKKYLGSGYTVKASVGHVKDLPKSKIGVDTENDFAPQYETVKGKEKVLAEIKKHAAVADRVYLATDPDREGEAIAWHIKEELKHPDAKRVLFNEITKKSILEAIAHPGELDRMKYDSQQARRILDRLVGYQISPILWTKVRRGLSAGRVQSVAVRLVVEREREIKAFVPQEYWTLDAELRQAGASPSHSPGPAFLARLSKVDGKKAEINDRATAEGLVAELQSADFNVTKVDRRERRRNAPAPFITSKMQQEAANRLHFSAKKTMTLAQRLYEGVELGEEGQTALITYMRTDSTRLSDDAVKDVRALVEQQFGKDYLPSEPVVFKSKKNAQDAHEAIRPVSLEYPPSRVQASLEPDMFRLYELIWNRFVACQMKPAVYDQTTADITASRATFRASGSTLKFPGYLAVYGQGLTTDEEAESAKAKAEGGEAVDDANRELPLLNEGELLKLLKLLHEQHFTQPPPRFSEATLVKELEEKGIGRPSTYASILSVIQDKEYVEKVEGRFRPTELGHIITTELVKHFPNELDVTFTAGMEEKLDQISEGEVEWQKVLGDFYGPFQQTLVKAQAEMRDVKREEIPTDIACVKCNHPMVIKWGKMGRFLACSNYPECKSTKDFKEIDGKIIVVEEELTSEVCDKCGKPMAVKRGRFGRFLACTGYPDCKGTKPMSIGVACPTCKVGYLTERRSRYGKVFFGCSRYPDCTFAAWDRPLPEACPTCAAPYLLQKYSKRDGPYIACSNKECDYRRAVDESGNMGQGAGAEAPSAV